MKKLFKRSENLKIFLEAPCKERNVIFFSIESVSRLSIYHKFIPTNEVEDILKT